MYKQPIFRLSLIASLLCCGAANWAYAQDSRLVGEQPIEGGSPDSVNLVAPQNEYVEFSSSFLRGENEVNKVDVSRFSHGDAIPAGEYDADIYVNEQHKGMAKLIYRDDGEKSILCLTPTLKAIFDLTAEGYANEVDEAVECVNAASAIKGQLRFDLGQFRLDLTIPQAWVVRRPQGYVSPAQWQEGVPVLFANYDVNHYRYRTTGMGFSQQTYLGLQGGLNIGGWAIRHSGATEFSQNSLGQSSHTPYVGHELYARRGIAQLQGDLTVGDFSTSGQLLEGVAIRGFSIASDDRMLPYSQRGYAPVVQGIADSNANVTVRQGGNIIYQTTVPAGPFIIDDLYPSGYVGDLEVEVKESNGQTRTFKVPYASVAQLIRQGHWRYNLSAGRYRYGSYLSKENLLQASLQYGLSNNLTLNVGGSYNRHYQSVLGGAAFNTPIGAVSADVTHSFAMLPYAGKKKGYSLHANYSVSLPSTDTNLTLAAYRYSSQNFYTLRETIWFNDQGDLYLNNLHSLYLRPKHQLQVVLNQRLGDKWGVVYLSGSSSHFWHSKRRLNQYQLSYANRYKALSYQLGYSHAYDTENKTTDKRTYLSFSLPLGQSSKAPSLSTSFNRAKGTLHNYTAVNGSLGDYSEWNYGYSLALSKHSRETATSTYLGYQHDYASLRTTFGWDNQGNRQGSFSANGAMVIHPKGITLTKGLNDSFAIIHAKGVSGARILGTQGAKLDRFGNGIVPYLSPYEVNTVGIDPEGMPLNIELSDTRQEIIPRADSAILVNFEAKQNAMVLFDVTFPDGTVPPMAAEAFDEQKKLVGYVVQGGRLFAGSLTQTQGHISVVWGTGEQGRCGFDYHIPDLNRDNVTGVKQYAVTCQK